MHRAPPAPPFWPFKSVDSVLIRVTKTDGKRHLLLGDANPGFREKEAQSKSNQKSGGLKDTWVTSFVDFWYFWFVELILSSSWGIISTLQYSRSTRHSKGLSKDGCLSACATWGKKYHRAMSSTVIPFGLRHYRLKLSSWFLFLSRLFRR